MLMERCGGCGRMIPNGGAHSVTVLEDKRYAFCCEMCESAFEAASFQRQLISDSFESSAVSFYINYRPALQIGGDYAKTQLLGKDLLYLIIGDVSGHGITASLLMSHINTAVESLVSSQTELPEIVNTLDGMIRSLAGSRALYLTLFCARVNLHEGVMSFINCGHLAPMLWSRERRQIQLLESHTVPVGLMHLAGGVPDPESRPIAADDCLALFTDGLVEHEDENGTELGKGGIRLMFEEFIADPSGQSARTIFEKIQCLPKPEDDSLLALVHFKEAQR